MARSRKPNGLTKAQRTFYVALNTESTEYIDVAQCLSIVNRKLMSQTKCYGIESLEFDFFDARSYVNIDTVRLQADVIPDNWVSMNAYVKGKALWNEMQALVLDDNPSIPGKWHDFKIFMDSAHRAKHLVGGVGNLIPRTGSETLYQEGEWNYSDYVIPQHDVDPATGQPLAADECQAHMLGPDIGVIGAFQSIGLVNAYALSRATVFDDAPNVPAGFATSFFNLLTDQGSQEPELAARIRAENEDPPYDLDDYPGGAVNAVDAVVADMGAASAGAPNGILGPFVAPCGIIKLQCNGAVIASDGTYTPVGGGNVLVKVTVMAGDYKGVAAIDMGQ
jgi:hypothetical protein